jgi:hypothetical protein
MELRPREKHAWRARGDDQSYVEALKASGAGWG